ncbi:MAG: spermidine/putrescine ABC transporter substrate-binding protein [Verrucomicrobiota bacterium]|jgi:spermidine/putrescine transport system substrate-binding protein|nr:spermidine/putrescine ABC transporter substrate-binding protein [Verrucomicrobiota bacterium]
MRKILFGVALALLVGAFGCGEKKPVLHIYTWSDYVDPELIDRFEAENNCRVVVDTYNSNESMYAKLKAGARGYDLLFPSSYMVKLMHDQGMLEELDHTRLPNLGNIDPAYLALALDTEMAYSVPYTVTITCLGYRGSRVENFEPTWAMFDRTDLKNRMTLLDDYREVIGAALKFLGYSINTLDDAQLKEAKDVVLRWKKNIAKFENEQYKTGLASGEFLLTHGYSGDLMLVQGENDDIQIDIPREGSVFSFDDMVIPVGARQPDLAHRFINFVLEPAVAAQLTEFIYFLCPNTPSYEFLSDEIREDPILFPPEDVVAKLEMIRDLGADNEKYTKLWDEIKAGDAR